MNRNLKKFIVIVLCFICLNVHFTQNNISKSTIPQSQTTYELNLSIDSPYYSLSNVKITIYDYNSSNWVTVNTFDIILLTTIYKLRIYNLDEILLFEDTDDQEWTENYRIIVLDQLIKITNNHPYPLNVSYTQYNTVYETIFLKPTSDVTVEWTQFPASGNHYAKIDETTIDPADYIYCSGAITYTDTFGLGDISSSYDYFSANGFTIHLMIDQSAPTPQPLNVDYYIQSVWNNHIATIPQAVGAPEYVSYTIYNTYTQTELNAMQFRFKKLSTETSTFHIYQANISIFTFHSDNVVSDWILINPYDAKVIQALVSNTITITDLYGETIESGTYSAGEHIILTPDEQEQCVIQYVDQNNHALDFDQFITWVNGSLVTDPNFIATRATDVEVITCTLENATIETTLFLINNSLNYLTIPIDTLYLTNNAREPVNMRFNEGVNYKGRYSFDFDSISQHPIGWWETLNNHNSSANIIEEYQGHRKVLFINYGNTISTPYQSYYVAFTLNTLPENFEFYYTIDPTSNFGGYMVAANTTSTPWYIDMTKTTFRFNYRLGSSWIYGSYITWDGTIWNHIRIGTNITHWICYVNQVEVCSAPLYATSLTYIKVGAEGNNRYIKSYYDAFDFTSSAGYYINRNLEANTSTELWSWEAYPVYEGEYYQSTAKGNAFKTLDYGSHSDAEWNAIGWDISGTATLPDISIVDWLDHKKVVNMSMTYPGSFQYVNFVLTPSFSSTSGYVEYHTCYGNSDSFLFQQALGNTTSTVFPAYLTFSSSSVIIKNRTGSILTTISIGMTQWRSIRWSYSISGTNLTHRFYISGNTYTFIETVTSGWYFKFFYFYVAGTTKSSHAYLDAFALSTETGFFRCMTLFENASYSPLAMDIDFSQQVNPYSDVTLNYTIGNYLVRITDLYNNTLDMLSLDDLENEFIFTPEETRQCFIALSDQRGQYLDWENYKIYLNNTLIYRNYFNAELNSIWNITVKDRFNFQMTSTLHTVDRDENYIALTITLHTLKIYNQQELYIYSNLTRTGTSQYWTEWIAPREYVAYRLLAGAYQFNITEWESSTSTTYGYTLAGDDYLLITSTNTITNAITNIINTNTTIGNQITAVNISITNTQTNISNQIVSVNIDLNNINSTLDAQLINIQADLFNLDSNITTMYAFVNNSFINLNSSLGTQFLNVNTTLANINNSISLLISDVETTVLLVNNSIYTAVVDLETQLLLINNTLYGNLSLILQINPELGAIYTNCLFSKNLTWSTNLTSMYAQFDYYAIKNHYRNESLELQLRYGNEIIVMGLEGQETINQAIKTIGTQFRVKSVRTGEYLENYSTWQSLPSDKRLDLGFYDEIIPATPEQVILEQKDFIMIGVVVIIALAVFASAYIRMKSQLEEVPAQFRTKLKPRSAAFIGGKEDLTTYFDVGQQARTPRKKKRSWISMLGLPLLILIFGIVIVIFIL